MKVIVTIKARIKRPKVGDQYCASGLGGRNGFFCHDIQKVTKNYIVVAGEKISMKEYAFREAWNTSPRLSSVGVEIL